MNTRFYNGRICTMERAAGEYFEGELWTQGDKVSYAGPPKKADIPFDREIDLDGDLLLPGFKNAHTHSAMTFLRSYADDLPLQEWLNEQVFPMEAKLTGDDVYWLAKLAVMEYLTSGITANLDMYMFHDDIARASAECGFRTVIDYTLNDFTGSLEELEACYLRHNSGSPLVRARLAVHAEYTCGAELLRGVAALAKKYKAPVDTHNSETRREVEDCLARHGATPTAYLAELGLFDHGGTSYHCVHVTEADMNMMKERGMYVVSNPGSNVKLASGIAPVSRMLELGLPVALGTDGPASNNCLDFFREMFLVTGLQKIATGNAAAVGYGSVLQMATVAGARAMGLPECDSLAPGKQADLTVFSLKWPNAQPLNNPLANLVYSGSKQNIRLTMVAGRVLYEDGAFHIGVEPEAVYARANEIMAAKRQG